MAVSKARADTLTAAFRAAIDRLDQLNAMRRRLVEAEAAISGCAEAVTVAEAAYKLAHAAVVAETAAASKEDPSLAGDGAGG